MTRLYEAPVYDTAQFPDSLWQTEPAPPAPALAGEARADVAVIGAGFAGLNAALDLARVHGRSVAVLEAGPVGFGASGRNGGFCCIGSAKLSDAAIVRRVGAEGLRDFRAWQARAIAGVADRLSGEGIDADRGPDGEVQLAHSPRAFAAMKRAARADPSLTVLPPEALRQAGLHGPRFHGGLRAPLGFPLHPMKYLLGLVRAVQGAGVAIHAHTPATGLSPSAGGWRITTPDGVVTAPQILVATNGYSSENMPAWIGRRTLPVLSSILVTRPLTQDEQAAQGWTSQVMAYDARQLLHYFRLLPDGRFLFGMRGGVTADRAGLRATQARTRRHFETLFPAWAGVETARSWSGLACLTGSLAPFVGPVPATPGVYAAFGWHGNGVAAASQGGRDVAALIAGRDPGLPALLTRPPPRFPLPALRRLWLRAAYAAMTVADGPI